MRRSGQVKFFDDARGFGFICLNDSGDELFVHRTALAFRGADNEALTLVEGQRVSFDVVETDKGLKAISVDVDHS